MMHGSGFGFGRFNLKSLFRGGFITPKGMCGMYTHIYMYIYIYTCVCKYEKDITHMNINKYIHIDTSSNNYQEDGFSCSFCGRR